MKKDLLVGLAWASGMILLALGAVFARKLGYIDHDAAQRVIAMNGLVIAYYGNLAPKTVAPSACARQVSRVCGWSLFLSGLAYAGLWIFAPISIAASVGTGAVAAGVIVTLSYCLWVRARAHRFSRVA